MASDGMRISESIEFLTQIHSSWDGTEQRSSVRPLPRRMLSYDYIGVNGWQSQYLRALAYAQQTQLFQIPVWHSASTSQDAIFSSANSLRIEKEAIWGWRGATHAMVWLSDGFGGDVYGVNTIGGDGGVSLLKTIPQDWEAGKAVLCPVVWGVLKNEDKFTITTSEYSELTLNVEIVRETYAPALPASHNEYHDEAVKKPFCNGLPQTYQGIELFTTSPSWADAVSSDFTRNAYRLDNSTGPFVYDLRGPNPTEKKELPFVLKTRQEINNFQRFFYRMKGRLHSFYAPTWLNDIELAHDAPNGQAYLLAKFPMYWKYFTNTSRRKTLVIFKRDNTAEIVKVGGYSTSDDGELGKVWLDSPLKKPLNMKDVWRISYLSKYRFDNDSMVMDYATPTVGTTSMPFVEVTN